MVGPYGYWADLSRTFQIGLTPDPPGGRLGGMKRTNGKTGQKAQAVAQMATEPVQRLGSISGETD